MANYTCASRTNYFRVTDEAEYEKLFNCLCSEDSIEDMSETRNSVIYHAFGSYGSIDYCDDSDPDSMDDIEVFAKKLQKIMPDDDAFILFESGNEKLRYVTGTALIVTKNSIKCPSIQKIAIDMCKSLLGNDNFDTQTSY